MTGTFETCIVCTERPPGDPEHVIPRIIGGRLKVPILCDKCNHDFGSRVVSDLKKDASIRLAIEALSERIPALARSYSEGTEYLGKDSKQGQVSFTKRGDSLRIIPGKASDDSVVLETKDALSALSKKLNRSGYSKQVIKGYLHKFEAAEEDELVAIPTGEVFAKRSVSEFGLKLSGETIKSEFWNLIALEFSALVIGNLIYRESFDSVRGFLIGAVDQSPVEISHFAAGNEYAPFHLLRLVPDKPILSVEVRLFRLLATVIDFPWIQYGGPHPVYFEDLKHSKSYFAIDANHASRGEWIDIG